MSEQDKEDFTEIMLDSKTVYRGVLLDVVADRVRLPDGTESVREYIHHPGACMVIWLTTPPIASVP